MRLIDHIHRCNRWTPENFVPLWVDGNRVGWLSPAIRRLLGDFPTLFLRQGDGMALSSALTTPQQRSEALRPVAERLAADGVIPPLRGEDYRVVADWGQPDLLAIDRALVPAFGIRAFGVHVNGLVRGPDGLSLWIGTRAGDKAVEPGKLDNMVAGGQPAGLSLRDNLIKEAAEEAGLGEEVACQAVPVAAITYCMEEGVGLKRDTLFIYDLALGEEIKPQPNDGEMSGFSLMSLPSLLDLLRQGFTFKFNVALVLIDFMIRHGALGPDNEPDYLALATKLHMPLD